MGESLITFQQFVVAVFAGLTLSYLSGFITAWRKDQKEHRGIRAENPREKTAFRGGLAIGLLVGFFVAAPLYSWLQYRHAINKLTKVERYMNCAVNADRDAFAQCLKGE